MRTLGSDELIMVNGGDNYTFLYQCMSLGAVCGGVSALLLCDDWVEDDLLNLVIDYIGISVGILAGSYGGLCAFNYF